MNFTQEYDMSDERRSFSQLFSMLGFSQSENENMVSQLCAVATAGVRSAGSAAQVMSDSVEYLTFYKCEFRRDALRRLGFSPKAVKVFSVGEAEGWFDRGALAESCYYATDGTDELLSGDGIWLAIATNEESVSMGVSAVPATFHDLDSDLRFGPSFLSVVRVQEDVHSSGAESKLCKPEVKRRDSCQPEVVHDAHVSPDTFDYDYLRLIVQSEHSFVLDLFDGSVEVFADRLLEYCELAIGAGLLENGVRLRYYGFNRYYVVRDERYTAAMVVEQLRLASADSLATIGGISARRGDVANLVSHSEGLTAVADVPDLDGLCYLVLFETHCRGQAYDELGRYPSVQRLMDMPEHWYVDVQRLREIACGVRGQTLHLFEADDSVKFISVCLHLGAPEWLLRVSTADDKLGELVDTSFVRSVRLDTLVGADSPPQKVKMTLLKGGKGKAVCGSCGAVAWPEEHRTTCPTLKIAGGVTTPAESTARLAWVGDAMHTMDVRALIATYFKVESQMSIEAVKFTSASAQRLYLEIVESDALPPGRSDHAWGTEFEIRYHGDFRRRYLKWLMSRLAVGGDKLSSKSWDLALSYSQDLHGLL